MDETNNDNKGSKTISWGVIRWMEAYLWQSEILTSKNDIKSIIYIVLSWGCGGDNCTDQILCVYIMMQDTG